ncbi:hypothetical protein VPH35_048945 [Triticum aestivum]
MEISMEQSTKPISLTQPIQLTFPPSRTTKQIHSSSPSSSSAGPHWGAEPRPPADLSCGCGALIAASFQSCWDLASGAGGVGWRWGEKGKQRNKFDPVKPRKLGPEEDCLRNCWQFLQYKATQ